ncbi:arylsulfatase [Aquimarina algiphila]|uniref:Arylsulfatase n=1 Tax=Aquimarina algiphila TaxID=2047982 RepID=A0A554VQK8_9FLAO|nr:arylsulfatase [Aquimarina algiphila]TSE10823.1 arylsulfatase [Aquimarina algiphila]
MNLIKKLSFLVLTIILISCQEKPKESKVVDSDITSSKPNVILIVTDDQGYGDIGVHGNSIIKTPNLDKFAGESLELTNFHVGTTCTPTRAGIMTGRNANRNNAWHTIAGCSILQEDEETMAEVFVRNGYQTAMFGKWHLGDNKPFRPQDRGFQEALYNGGGGVGQTPDYWGNDYFDDTYFRNGTPEKFKGYCTDVWFDEAIQYIEGQKEKPFFMYLATNAAHGPFNVPKEYMDMYKKDTLNESQKRFYGMITNIDDNFGKLTSYLEKSGLSENTIIIFTTDNGTANGINYNKVTKQTLGYNAGLKGTKGSHYDGGHRVPFFIRWPKGKVLKKSKINELVAHVDLLPTLTELVGIEYQSKKTLDGISVVSLLEGKTKTIVDRMLVVDTQRKQWPEKGRNPCVMSTRWRLVNGNELYDFVNDPGQKIDLSSKHPDEVVKMQNFYDTWWESIQSDIKYAQIPVGGEDKDPVRLTIHDLHTEENLPWHEGQIRNGEFHPEGYYTIRVEESGNYQFNLRRYPEESGLSIDQDIESIASTPYKDGQPVGKGLQVSKAIVNIGNLNLKTDVDINATSAILSGHLEKGEYKLSCTFVNTEGKKFSAYYTSIEKL